MNQTMKAYLHLFLSTLWLSVAFLACVPTSAAQTLETTKPLPAWLRPLPVFAVIRMRTNVGGCSAVAISAHQALTAAHCLPPETYEVQLESLDGKEHALVSYAIPTPGVDEAVMTVREPFITFSQVAPALPQAGDLVFLSGYGCFGIIDVRPATYLGPDHDHDVALNGMVCLGDSGGPVFNDKGQVLAVIKSTPKERVPAVWATPVVPAA